MNQKFMVSEMVIEASGDNLQPMNISGVESGMFTYPDANQGQSSVELLGAKASDVNIAEESSGPTDTNRITYNTQTGVIYMQFDVSSNESKIKFKLKIIRDH
jgi:hypothetical protein